MEISNEIKARVFAHYLGQKMKDYCAEPENDICTLTQVDVQHGCVADEHGNFDIKFNDVRLLLRPPNAITDEDAIEVGRIIGHDFGDYAEGKSKVLYFGKKYIQEAFDVEWINRHVQTSWQVGQFLQLRGYDLPNYLLGGKTLHEAGLAVYK